MIFLSLNSSGNTQKDSRNGLIVSTGVKIDSCIQKNELDLHNFLATVLTSFTVFLRL